MLARFSLMVTLVFAGEVVFGLPFQTSRFFRPTMLEAFGLNNAQLGDMLGAYGVTAMLAYFPGGMLADRFSARSLLTASLVATGVGGFFMATYPGRLGMLVLFAYWGVTTILLFWSAMIRATREWGGADAQGRAFGILEGGRGLVAALLASIGVAVFALAMPDVDAQVTPELRRAAFRSVILMYSVAAFVAGVLTWLLVPPADVDGASGRGLFEGAGFVLSRPIVWAHAATIVCAYCCFKGLDNYSLYAVQVLGMNEIDGARLASWGAWSRPAAAFLAGVLADRWSGARTLRAAFVLLLVCYAVLSVVLPDGVGLVLIYLNLFVSFAAVFALRGVYFALLNENRVPPFLTGAVAGTVSFIGFTPDVFFGPVTGRILDANPGLVGHQNYFLFLAAIALLAIGVVFWLLRLQQKTDESTWPADVHAMKRDLH
ncbi:MAG: MFS transporter [Woeseiaceae bacterium]